MPLGLTASGLRIFRFGVGGASWRHWRGQHVLPTCRRSIDQSRATTELRVSGACNVASTAAAASGGGQPLPAPVWLQWPSMRHGGGCAQQVSSRLACRCSQGHCKGRGVPGELVLPGGPGQCTRIVCPYQVDWHQSAGRWSPALGLRSLQRDFWAFAPSIHHRDYLRRARHRRRAHIDGTCVSTCVLIVDLDDRSAPDNACITRVLAAGVRTTRGGKGPDSGEPSRKSGGASRPTCARVGLSILKTQTVQGGLSPVRVLPTRHKTAAWRPKRKGSIRRLTRCP